MRRTLVSSCLALAAAAASFLAAPAHACTASPMSMDVMADHAAQVVIGEVTMIRSYWTEDGRAIESEITLTGVEYLKGRRADSRSVMTLKVPGGTVGSITMRLCCVPEIQAGERYAMFLLPEYRTYPTVGMAQGLFKIERDEDGRDRVLSANGLAIAGLDQQGMPFTIVQRGSELARTRLVGENGAALRVDAMAPGEKAAPVRPMALDAFKTQLRPILARSRAHAFDGQAGRRIAVELRPTTLKLAPNARTMTEAQRAALDAIPRPERREIDVRDARPIPHQSDGGDR